MTGSLSPEDFKTALDDAMTQRTEERPSGVAVADDLRAGRQLLRRRRVLQSTLGLAVASAVVTVAGAAGLLGGAPDRASDTVAAAPTESSIARACLDGNQSAEDTRLMAAGGGPVVAASESNRTWTMAALLSGDGSHWAECFISHDPYNEFGAGMTVYPSAGRTSGTSFSSGTGCPKTSEGVDRGCRHYSVRWVDRLPSEVAAVRFETNDGQVRDVATVDGFVVFNRLGELPEGVEVDRDGGTGRWQPLHQVTYLDASGKPLAAARFDGTGRGPLEDRVEGLPSLMAYPSARGEPVF